jgi:anti-sigma-K factor RskA
MNIQEYIESGILELYVFGALSPEEAEGVGKKLREHPEIREEVEQIEKALHDLSIAVAPYNPEKLLASIKQKLKNPAEPIPVIEIEKRRKNWPAYIGWAASVVLLIGLFVLLDKNNSLRDELQTASAENAQMEEEIEAARQSEEKTKQLLEIYRNRNLKQVELAGQKAAPEAYATVIWDQEKNQAFIDAQGLPEPPQGKVYQVWSLTLNPLKPTSIGLLENFEKDENKIFLLPNTNESQAFGISLEPAGGSKTPTMEQLYTLGAVDVKS